MWGRGAPPACGLGGGGGGGGGKRGLAARAAARNAPGRGFRPPLFGLRNYLTLSLVGLFDRSLARFFEAARVRFWSP